MAQPNQEPSAPSTAAQPDLPQLHWTFINYPSWKRQLDNFLDEHNLLHTCRKTFYDIAASRWKPWTEQERSENKRIFEAESKLTLALTQQTLTSKLKLQIHSLKDTSINTSPKKLVEYLAKRYNEELPAIRSKIEADWTNWSLKPTGGFPTMALTTVAHLISAGKVKQDMVQSNIFLDGFCELKDIWIESRRHGNKIPHKDFIDKYLNGMAQVTDKNKSKQVYISAVANLLWAEKEPTIEQVRGAIESVKEEK